MPYRVERKPGQSVGDQLGLTLPSGRKGSVGETMLRILMFTMSDQIYVVRHNSLASSPASAGP